jgi:predicted transcriptional regulator
MSREAEVIAIINESAPIAMPAIAKRLGISNANASVVLSRLYRKGVIGRSGSERRYEYHPTGVPLPTEKDYSVPLLDPVATAAADGSDGNAETP